METQREEKWVQLSIMEGTTIILTLVTYVEVSSLLPLFRVKGLSRVCVAWANSKRKRIPTLLRSLHPK
jgi:hypothetical protein